MRRKSSQGLIYLITLIMTTEGDGDDKGGFKGKGPRRRGRRQRK